MSLAVRPARRPDTPVIYGFVRQLAEYENLLLAVSATENDIAQALWGPSPRASCEIAEADGRRSVGVVRASGHAASVWPAAARELGDVGARSSSRTAPA